MYPDGLTESEKLKVKELCTMVNISDEDALKLLKENDWDIVISSRRVSKQEDKSLVPGTSKEHIDGDLDRLSSRLRVHGLAFYLPDFAGFPNEFRTFLEKDLIETQTQKRLEASRHLNWWHQFGQKLYPLSTTGDGNCLLHAASLGMWGVHDRQLSLRETLYELLTNGARKEAIRRRWKWIEHHMNQSNDLALTLSDAEWELEWDVVLGLSSPLPRKQEDNGSNSTDQIYESLEAIHVFSLAHVLKRPIVVVSDTILRNAKGEELSPVAFGGIYLPLECPPSQCHRSPLVLCYDAAHFSPLVLMRTETNNKQIIPIIDVNRNLLPVHFAVDPGESFDWSKLENNSSEYTDMSQIDKLALISRYMDIIRLDVRRGSIRSTRRVRSAHAQLSESRENRNPRDTSANSGTNSGDEQQQQPSNNAKGMTLASSGIVTGRHEKWRLINEIRSQVLRTLRISSSTNRSKEKLIDTDDCIARMNSTCVLASELLPTHHQYMDKIINEYMKSAKQRFQQNQRTQADCRKRISRSFSASSLMLTCIGCDSEFKPASQVTNIMCDQCFAWQKMSVLTSNCDQFMGNSGPPCKSSTLPSFGSEGGGTTSEKENIVEVLNVVPKDGSKALTSMRAVEDENGIVHYYMDDEISES
uniref:ubiquitinyl hydrolase 1 n=1 Tax=Caenorhabditis tropicalis TaxID=1561998 RepID=A0A1I7T822_9PELO